jgi:hypothetical protein
MLCESINIRQRAFDVFLIFHMPRYWQTASRAECRAGELLKEMAERAGKHDGEIATPFPQRSRGATKKPRRSNQRGSKAVTWRRIGRAKLGATNSHIIRKHYKMSFINRQVSLDFGRRPAAPSAARVAAQGNGGAGKGGAGGGDCSEIQKNVPVAPVIAPGA